MRISITIVYHENKAVIIIIVLCLMIPKAVSRYSVNMQATRTANSEHIYAGGGVGES